MSVQIVEANLGFSSADAERVSLSFSDGVLMLSFIDWKENPMRIAFHDVLGFRWQEFDIPELRADSTYRVLNSEWLENQAQLQSERASDFNHLIIGFNAVGMLEVLCKGLPQHA